MPYRRGDVIAVPYDYSDLTGGKVRPAVIVSRDAYNLHSRMSSRRESVRKLPKPDPMTMCW
jgi:mRNA-degrading endonuclease toxin of MazEF toxin-antitoxin module